LRVLVAGDNEDAAQTLATLLQLDGHTIRTAFDGEEAVAHARQFDPDIIWYSLSCAGQQRAGRTTRYFG
jgi:CheY-like chemotaxis protein